MCSVASFVSNCLIDDLTSSVAHHRYCNRWRLFHSSLTQLTIVCPITLDPLPFSTVTSCSGTTSKQLEPSDIWQCCRFDVKHETASALLADSPKAIAFSPIEMLSLRPGEKVHCSSHEFKMLPYWLQNYRWILLFHPWVVLRNADCYLLPQFPVARET